MGSDRSVVCRVRCMLKTLASTHLSVLNAQQRFAARHATAAEEGKVVLWVTLGGVAVLSLAAYLAYPTEPKHTWTGMSNTLP